MTNLFGDRARLRTLQPLRTQNTLAGWSTSQMKIGFPCGNGVKGCCLFPECNPDRDSHMCFIQTGLEIHVLHRKYCQVCVLEAFLTENEALTTICPGKRETSNTRICKPLPHPPGKTE